MGVGELCSREVVFIRRSESVLDAARLMREQHVGSLVVVDVTQVRRVPVGMITDRDIVVGIVALRLDAQNTQVEAAMRAEVVAITESEGIGRAAQLMRAKGVRRLPVVDAAGALVGVLAADDLLELLAEEMSGLAGMLGRGASRERAERTAVL